MHAFSISIFLSAFLLFIVQPLLAKKLLPWFGGSPAVWLSIVLFFQIALLVGYLYAFALTKIKKLSTQVIIHFTLLLLSLIFIPIAPYENASIISLWPHVAIMTVLSLTFLLPGILICASSPLFQHWYCQCYQTDFPYRFYALSNFGSLLGLIAFPFILEPLLGIHLQLYLWSGFYLLFLLSSSACLILVTRRAPEQMKSDNATSAVLSKTALSWWVLLTFLSSALLLSTTQVTLQNIAGFPLLWVIPLALYLISFIITFAYPKSYYRPLWIGLFCVLCGIVFYFPSHHKFSLMLQIGLYSGLLFSGCMICQGELIRLKPDKSLLTSYYLAIALGGVLGGFFVNLAAPLIFNEWWDFYSILFGVFLCGAYFSVSLMPANQSYPRLALGGIWAIAFVGLGILLSLHLKSIHQDVIYHHRNFFGAFEIAERNPNIPEHHYRTLTNGNILHGKQYLEPAKRNLATSYYSLGSGVGLAVAYQREQKQYQTVDKGLRIGVIGLGTGTIAALTMRGDHLHFYEIDPDIEKIAKEYFYYLHDTPANVAVDINDGRIALEDKFKQSGSEHFDVLAVDAFNGDAIPVHLLTLEAMQIYLSHLAPNGILAFHVSSRYVDLYPPLQALANDLHLFAFTTTNAQDLEKGIFNSQWILITRNGDLGAYLYSKNVLFFPNERITPVWTDDFNYLLSVIRWK